MTIKEAINQADMLRAGNTCSEREKRLWLSAIDGIIKKEIIDTHEGCENVSFSGYDTDTDGDTVLIAPAPYDELYISYLMAKIDLACSEYAAYNNTNALFETQYRRFAAYWNRTHISNGAKTMKFSTR